MTALTFDYHSINNVFVFKNITIQKDSSSGFYFKFLLFVFPVFYSTISLIQHIVDSSLSDTINNETYDFSIPPWQAETWGNCKYLVFAACCQLPETYILLYPRVSGGKSLNYIWTVVNILINAHTTSSYQQTYKFYISYNYYNYLSFYACMNDW